MSATNESLIIENPYGRLFVHGLGGGAAMVLIEKEGANMMLPLDTEQAGKLGRFLFFARSEDEARQAMSRPLEASEPLEVEHEVEALGGVKRVPLAASRPRRGVKVRRDGKVSWTPALERRLVAAYMEEGAAAYKAENGRHFGRAVYAADKLGLPATSAKARITALRARGMIPKDFYAGRGRKPEGMAKSAAEDLAQLVS